MLETEEQTELPREIPTGEQKIDKIINEMKEKNENWIKINKR